MGLTNDPCQLRRTHLERTHNLRQSYTRARFQKSCFFLFKCLSCKLRLFFNGDFILGNKDSKDGYAFRFKKPGKITRLNQATCRGNFKHTFGQGKHEHLTTDIVSCRAFTQEENPLTNTEGYESIAWPIFEEAGWLEFVWVFPITCLN